MNTILKVLITAVLVVVLSKILPGVSVEGYTSAIIVAVVLGLLRIIVKPILIILTLPFTILTLGLFLFVINAFIVLLADRIVDGFNVSGWWYALLFSLLLSFLQSLLQGILYKEEKVQ